MISKVLIFFSSRNMNSTNEQCLFYAFVDKKFVNTMTKQLPVQTPKLVSILWKLEIPARKFHSRQWMVILQHDSRFYCKSRD